MLDKFVWKKSELANCRCMLCGDSEKNKSLARGYFYLSKHRNFRYKCQNCGANWTASDIIKQVSPVLHDEYRLECLQELNASSNITQQKEHIDSGVVPSPSDHHSKTFTDVPELSALSPVFALPVFHPAYKYLSQERKFPKARLKELFFTPNYRNYVYQLQNEFGHKNIVDIDSKYPTDERIIIPFIERGTNKLVAIQGRAIDTSSQYTIRYTTTKLDDMAVRVFGFERYDASVPGYCCEGPLDSLYLPNAFAAAGSSLYAVDQTLSITHNEYDVTYIPDNQPRNREIVREVRRLVEAGTKVVLWDHRSSHKDIGDMIESGMTETEVLREIESRTFQGIPAKLEFTQWAKV